MKPVDIFGERVILNGRPLTLEAAMLGLIARRFIDANKTPMVITAEELESVRGMVISSTNDGSRYYISGSTHDQMFGLMTEELSDNGFTIVPEDGDEPCPDCEEVEHCECHDKPACDLPCANGDECWRDEEADARIKEADARIKEADAKVDEAESTLRKAIKKDLQSGAMTCRKCGTVVTRRGEMIGCECGRFRFSANTTTDEAVNEIFATLALLLMPAANSPERPC